MTSPGAVPQRITETLKVSKRSCRKFKEVLDNGYTILNIVRSDTPLLEYQLQQQELAVALYGCDVATNRITLF
jgi:hypothetical protein